MNRLRATLVALMLTAPLAVASPAHAIPGGLIVHTAPDAGYDKPFRVRCDGSARTVLIHEGQSSDFRCTSRDVERIYVRAGEQLRCQARKMGRHWVTVGVVYDRTGWHDVHNWDAYRCVAEVD